MQRVAMSTLNASTLDILNVIRQNASPEYQSAIPTITSAKEVSKVGEVLYGNFSLSNEFLNALVNRIGLVRAKSMTFNNPYSRLKKGYLDFGETIEDIFVGIIKAYQFSDEKEGAREYKKYMPNVEATFHKINWQTMYPVSIEQEQLRKAFLSLDGVTTLISEIVDGVYKSAEYDEFLLFKYLLIKSITNGKFAPVSVGSTADLKNSAKAFRGTSNSLQFPKKNYNEANVLNNTPKERQVIFMDAQFNADYDVEVLASAFNMDKATFMGSLFLIDDWTTFDNDRFSQIRAESDGLEEVTSAELALMADVKAVLVDEDWFQVYDVLAQFTEKYVASELRWNYFYHTWKIISHSPFANAVVFVTSNATITTPSTLTFKVATKDVSDDAITLTLVPSSESASLQPNDYQFVQTEACIENAIGVHPYGAYLIPDSAKTETITVTVKIGNDVYASTGTITGSGSDVGDTITLSKQSFNQALTVASPLSSFEIYDSTVGAVQSGVKTEGEKIVGTLKFIEGGIAQGGILHGDGYFLALKFTEAVGATYSSIKVGLNPSEGTGLVELLGDPDMVGVFRITNNETQVLKIESTTSNGKLVQTYDLSDLVLETV